MVECDNCNTVYDPAEFDATSVGVPDPEGLCWECLISCCANCGDIPPYPIEEATQLCEMCHEHIFGDADDADD